MGLVRAVGLKSKVSGIESFGGLSAPENLRGFESRHLQVQSPYSRGLGWHRSMLGLGDVLKPGVKWVLTGFGFRGAIMHAAQSELW